MRTVQNAVRGCLSAWLLGCLVLSCLVLSCLVFDSSALAQQPLSLTRIATGLNFPEGPAFDGKGNVVVSNCYGGYIARFAVNAKPVSRIDTAFHVAERNALIKKTNGLTYFRDGSLYVCDFGRKAVIRIAANGAQTIAADSCDGKPLLGPNDLAFDPQGKLYFTDPTTSSLKNPIGAIYRLDPATSVAKRVADSLAFPNGIAVSADGKSLFVAESQKFHILRFRILPDGSLTEKSVFAQMPTLHDPDGIALDAAGNLWVAQYGAGAVRVFAPDGKLLNSVELPSGKNVTNLEFAGDDLKTLFITEAETGSVYTMHVETPGLPLHCRITK
jgi:gluconolactonase